MNIRELKNVVGSMAYSGIILMSPGSLVVFTYRNRAESLRRALSNQKPVGLKLRVYGVPSWIVRGKMLVYDRTTSWWWKKVA